MNKEYVEDKEYIYIYIHTHNGILLSHKEEQNSAICSNIYGLGGHYAKVK